MTNAPADLEQGARPFERWPGYDEQSWQQRFAELDRRYAALSDRMLAFAQPPASGVVRSLLERLDHALAMDAQHATDREWSDLLAVALDARAALTNSGAPVPGETERDNRTPLSHIRGDLKLAANPVPGDAGGAFERCAKLVEAMIPDAAGGPFSHTNTIRVVLYDAVKAIRALAHAAPPPSDEAAVPAGMVLVPELLAALEGDIDWLDALSQMTVERDMVMVRIAAHRDLIAKAREAAAAPSNEQATPTDEAVLADHIREQITHVQQRIEDGRAMGATVWRIALEDVVRENRAVLAARSAPGSAAGEGTSS